MEIEVYNFYEKDHRKLDQLKTQVEAAVEKVLGIDSVPYEVKKEGNNPRENLKIIVKLLSAMDEATIEKLKKAIVLAVKITFLDPTMSVNVEVVYAQQSLNFM